MTTEPASQTPSARTTFVTDVLAAYQQSAAFAKGQILFREGEEPLGIYFLQSGQVELVFASRAGEARTLCVAEAGQILGLSCLMSRKPHDCTATARNACSAGFIDRATFERLLEQQPSLWLKVLQMISTEVNACWDCMRALSGAR